MPRRGDTVDGRQAGFLFDAGDSQTVDAGSLNFDIELRAALSQAIAGVNKSREQVAVEMERLLGADPDFPVSKALIDAWTAPTRTGHRFPAAYLIAFIHVTQAHWLLDRIARKCGRVVLTGEAALHAELGKVRADRKRLADEEKALERKLGARR